MKMTFSKTPPKDKVQGQLQNDVTQHILGQVRQGLEVGGSEKNTDQPATNFFGVGQKLGYHAGSVH